MSAEFVITDSVEAPKRLGRAEVIKVDVDKSYWIFTQSRQDIALVAPQRVEFSFLNELSRGRRPTRIAQNQIVLPRGVTPIEYRDAKRDNELLQMTHKLDEYEALEKDVHLQENFEDVDYIVNEFDHWYESRSLEYVREYSQELSSMRPKSGGKHHDITQVEQDLENKAYDGLVNAYINHSQKVRDDKDRFFYEIRPNPDYPQVRQAISLDNTFERYQRQKNQRAEASRRAIDRMEATGPLWSADMDQDQMRNFFLTSGIEEEKRRQDRALHENIAHEITVDIATGLSIGYNLEDENFQGRDFGFGVFYEYHLVRTMNALQKWSVRIGVDRSKSYFDIGGFNAQYDEVHYHLGVNYYFLNHPSVVRRYQGYVGMGVKRGGGAFESAELENSYSHQSVRFPVYAGLKYRIRATDERFNQSGLGWGFGLELSYESGDKNLVGVSEEDFNRNINPGVMKLHFKISSYF